MPRTKRPKKVSEKVSLSSVDKFQTNVVNKPMEFKKQCDAEEAKRLEMLISRKEKMLQAIKEHASLCKIMVPTKYRTMTIDEIRNIPAELPTAYFDSTSLQNIINSTKKTNMSRFGATNTRRSRSVDTNDDGYLTADSTGESTTGRQSRARNKILPQKGRKSHSVSSKAGTASAKRRSMFRTPVGRAPPTEFATVTPKVKPNTSMVILRHPKPGEMIISMQGSPILVNSMVKERCANVNIPLEDGNLMSLQPELWTTANFTDIPNLPPGVQEELNTLSKNLEIVKEILKSKQG